MALLYFLLYSLKPKNDIQAEVTKLVDRFERLFRMEPLVQDGPIIQERPLREEELTHRQTDIEAYFVVKLHTIQCQSQDEINAVRQEVIDIILTVRHQSAILL